MEENKNVEAEEVIIEDSVEESLPVEETPFVEEEIIETDEEIVIDQEILDENPELVEAGVEVGDVGHTVDVTVKTYRGQEVISDGYRTVNEKTYRHIRLADGSTQDLTEEEYELEVKIQE